MLIEIAVTSGVMLFWLYKLSLMQNLFINYSGYKFLKIRRYDNVKQ